LWVDRSFAAKGSGTVVTGTLTGGPLHVDDEVSIEPGGLKARIRSLQTHNRPVPEASPGRRLAVNLAGVSHDRVQRGMAVTRLGQWHLTRLVDAHLRVLAQVDHDVGRRGAYAAYIGSGEHPVRLRVLGRGGPAIGPGEGGAVRLWLAAPLPLVPGDRYVLREAGRSETVGGGEILDVDPVLPAVRAAPSRVVERVVAERKGWVDAGELQRLTGEPATPTLGRWVVADTARAAMEEELRALIAAAGPLGLDVSILDERQRLVLGTLDDLDVRAGRVRGAVSEASDEDERLANHPWLAELERAPFSPPDPDGVNRADIRELARRGLVIDCEGVWFATSAVDRAAEEVALLLARCPEGITVAMVRDALHTTRKHALPLLARLDATGVTRRRGDVRIAGPRLPPL
jgi:selenocysteine-specific elongation factor